MPAFREWDFEDDPAGIGLKLVIFRSLYTRFEKELEDGAILNGFA
jgi:hypothetical protein